MSRIRAAVLHRNELFRTAAVAALWIGLHVYAGRPLLAAAHFEGMAPALAWGVLIAMPFVSMMPLFARRDRRLKTRTLAHWTGYATMSLFSVLLVLVFASDALRAVWFLAGLAWHAPALDAPRLTLALIPAAVALAAVGLVQARHPRVVRLPIAIENLPPELDGYRIVQWSDVHIGPTIQRDFLRCLVERTNELDADAIAITGDLVDGYLDDLRDEVQPLRDLRARDGVFYVTGNHEYYWRASDWTRELTRLGVIFLKNEHRVVRDGLVFAGVTDPAGRQTHRPDAAAALAGAPSDAIKVMLAHRPQAAEEASRLGVDLQLSGHTHGGQFFPFNLFIRWFQPVVRGLHRIGKTQLYVSRGTGYWGPPSRLGVGGEITVLELKSSEALEL